MRTRLFSTATRSFSLRVICLAALVACGASRVCVAAEVLRPGDDWPRVAPESVGIDSNRLVAALAVLREREIPIHGLAVVRRGKLALDASFYPFAPGGLHDIASCTKTVTAIGVGVAIDQGHIAGPEAKLVDIFASRTIGKLDDKKRAIRVVDLLTMRSGLFCLQEALSQMQMFQSQDWLQFCLDLPATRTPGEHFQYFSLNSHILSAAVQQTSGKPLHEVVREAIFEPLGIRQFGWPTDPQGVSHGWGDLRLQTQDMARLGWLLLQGGRWNERPVAPQAWVAAMLEPRVEVGQGRLFPQYGYQTWLGDQGFCFKGRGGQRIMGIPKLDLVIVSTAGASDAEEIVLDEQLAAISQAVQAEPRAEKNCAAVAALEMALTSARQPPPATQTTASDQTAKIDGARFDMEPNLYARQFAFRKTSASEGVFEVALPAIHRHADLAIKVGLDGVPRISPGRYGEPAAATAHWEDNTLLIDMDELGNINHWTWKLTFDDAGVTMEVSERTDLPRLRAKGKRVE